MKKTERSTRPRGICIADAPNAGSLLFYRQERKFLVMYKSLRRVRPRLDSQDKLACRREAGSVFLMHENVQCLLAYK